MGGCDEMSETLLSKILLATDASKDAELVAKAAMDISKRTDAELLRGPRLATTLHLP
jgi:hypothetical protein